MGVGLGIGIGVATVAALGAAYTGFWHWEVERLEKPRYAVRRKLGTIERMELRAYEPYIIAEALVSPDGRAGSVDDQMRAAMNQGFQRVGGFIFGGNTRKESVAMTSPVRMDRNTSESISMTSPVRMDGAPGTGDYRVSFVMPSKYTLETLPVPKEDLRVKCRQVDAHEAAAVTFYGGMDMGESRRQSAELRKAMEREGLEPAGPEAMYEYHPPFAPSFMRKREVVIPVKSQKK